MKLTRVRTVAQAFFLGLYVAEFAELGFPIRAYAHGISVNLYVGVLGHAPELLFVQLEAE